MTFDLIIANGKVHYEGGFKNGSWHGEGTWYTEVSRTHIEDEYHTYIIGAGLGHNELRSWHGFQGFQIVRWKWGHIHFPLSFAYPLHTSPCVYAHSTVIC